MAADAGKKLILVVDDEADIVTYLTTLFQDNGYETMSAANGNEGIEKVKERKPDLVTLDMSMPEKSGVRAYKELKENDGTKDIPVLVVTGVTGFGGKPEEFQKFLSSRKQFPPPEGFVPKPLDREELLGKVKELIG
jgi:CheY-like chemotaxis protein